MQAPAPSVQARVRLHGPFALGHREPEAGAAAGRRHGTSLGAHLCFDRPAGRVVGHVDAPGWPARALIEDGAATLGGSPPFVLDLRCHVGSDTFRVRAETAPGGLAVRMREADDGPVIGAGLASFGWSQAAAATPTIHPANATSTAAAWRARVDMATTLWRAARGCGRHG
jgi:hypothetical protein